MLKYSHLSQIKREKLIECFIFDYNFEEEIGITATNTAKILKLNRKTINKYYSFFRMQIFNFQKGKKYYTSNQYKAFERQRLKKFFGVKANLHLHKAESQWRFWKESSTLKNELLNILSPFLQAQEKKQTKKTKWSEVKK